MNYNREVCIMAHNAIIERVALLYSGILLFRLYGSKMTILSYHAYIKSFTMFCKYVLHILRIKFICYYTNLYITQCFQALQQATIEAASKIPSYSSACLWRFNLLIFLIFFSYLYPCDMLVF